MANRLIQNRRKCVKSPNIFRDKQEYSSLYTISSRSALSVQSTEMTSKNTNTNRVFKGHHKGDSAENVRSQAYKYPKLPNDISLELQQKVYTNSYKSYYNDRTQFIKNKFDSLTLENKQQQYPKPYCPMHISTGRYASQNTHKPPQHAINRLEESYWAKWKPNKCDSVETWQNCAEQTTTCYPCIRRPQCTTTRMMAQDCLNMLSQAKNRTKPKCCDDKPLKIIREPADIRESNSSDVGVVKKSCRSKHSCCTCPSRTSTDSDDEKLPVGMKTKGEMPAHQDGEDEPNTDEVMETSQEEYENLYNEMFIEYESDLMNRISEYEMQREQEEMRELERQLAEREDRMQLERASQKEMENDYVQHQRRESRKSEHENAYSNSRPTSRRQEYHQSREYEQSFNNPPTYEGQADQFGERGDIYQADQSRGAREKRPSVHYDDLPNARRPFDDERASIHSGDRTGTPMEIDQSRPKYHQSAEDPHEYHEDRPTPRQPRTPTEDQNRSTPIQQPSSARESVHNEREGRTSPRQSKTPIEDQIRSIPVEQPPTPREPVRDDHRGRTSPRQSKSPAEDQVRPTPIQPIARDEHPKSGDRTSPRHSRISESPKEQSRASSREKQREKPRERGGDSSNETRVHPNEETRNKIDKPPSTKAEELPRMSREQRNEETQQNRQRQLINVPDQELRPHLSYSNEYSEPEIAILKHTDSFIINSRRQKEDRQKKPQPKFLKLTKTTFSPPPVKGHTYPLKPVLKKEKPPAQPIIGFSRPISPNTPKMSTPTKQFQPSYLMR